MQVYELVEALGEVPNAQVSIRRGALRVHVPAVGDTLSSKSTAEPPSPQPRHHQRGPLAVKGEPQAGHCSVPRAHMVMRWVWAPALEAAPPAPRRVWQAHSLWP